MRSVALYWHFDRHGVVSAMVLRQLARHRDAGFAVVFISMAPIFATLRGRRWRFRHDRERPGWTPHAELLRAGTRAEGGGCAGR